MALGGGIQFTARQLRYQYDTDHDGVVEVRTEAKHASSDGRTRDASALLRHVGFAQAKVSQRYFATYVDGFDTRSRAADQIDDGEAYRLSADIARRTTHARSSRLDLRSPRIVDTMHEVFVTLDHDMDNRIALRSEANGSTPVAHLRKLDLDGDGSIRFREAVRAYAAFDRTGDGRIDPSERHALDTWLHTGKYGCGHAPGGAPNAANCHVSDS